MNFYDLFEASKDLKGKDAHEHDVSIVDPKAALALKTARNKYSYADSDLEAFVKMTQDKEEEEDKEIADLEKETAKQEELIQKNIEALQKNRELIDQTRKQATAAKERADHLERENGLQRQRIKDLEQAEKTYGAMADQYNEFSDRLKSEIATMQTALAGVETPKGAYRPATSLPDAPKRRRPDYVPPEQDTVLSRRIDTED